MTIEILASPKLDALAFAINHAFVLLDRAEANAGSHRVAAGRALLEARALMPASSAETWTAWLARNIKRSERDCQRCMALARAPEPEAAAAEERVSAAVAMRESRARARATNVSRDERTARLLTAPASWGGYATRYAALDPGARGLFIWFAKLSTGKQKQFLTLVAKDDEDKAA